MTQALDMSGTVDNEFKSINATRFTVAKGYTNGRPNKTPVEDPNAFTVTLQAVSERELMSLSGGGERVVDVRRVYINDGDLTALTNGDLWQFDGLVGTYRVIKLDNRPWRNYCKLIVSLKDEPR